MPWGFGWGRNKRAPPKKPPPMPTSIRSYTHTGVTCLHCRRTVTGYRYKCLICPNANLCYNCFNRSLSHARNVGDHLSAHPMARLGKVGSTSGINAVSGLLGASPDSPAATGVRCGVCHSMAFGVRYKCTVDGVDICSSCEAYGRHGQPGHTRLKIPEPTTGATLPAPGGAGGGAGAGVGGGRGIGGGRGGRHGGRGRRPGPQPRGRHADGKRRKGKPDPPVDVPTLGCHPVMATPEVFSLSEAAPQPTSSSSAYLPSPSELMAINDAIDRLDPAAIQPQSARVSARSSFRRSPRVVTATSSRPAPPAPGTGALLLARALSSQSAQSVQSTQSD